jgi:hypothetical protein
VSERTRLTALPGSSFAHASCAPAALACRVSSASRRQRATGYAERAWSNPDWADPFEWSEHTLRVLTAIGTVGAVIVALVLTVGAGAVRALRERRRRPDLSITHDRERDVSRETARVRVQSQQGLEEVRRDAVYLRLAVTNETGKHAAEGVEVLVAELEPLQPSEAIDPVHWDDNVRFNVGQLGWTHAEPFGLRLGPGARRTVDLGYVVDDPELGTTFALGLTIVLSRESICSLRVTIAYDSRSCAQTRMRVITN